MYILRIKYTNNKYTYTDIDKAAFFTISDIPPCRFKPCKDSGLPVFSQDSMYKHQGCLIPRLSSRITVSPLRRFFRSFSPLTSCSAILFHPRLFLFLFACDWQQKQYTVKPGCSSCVSSPNNISNSDSRSRKRSLSYCSTCLSLSPLYHLSLYFSSLKVDFIWRDRVVEAMGGGVTNALSPR